MHFALPPSDRLMRILGAVVLPPTALMAGANPKVVAAARFWSGVQFQQHAWQFLHRGMKQRSVAEHTVEMFLRQCELILRKSCRHTSRPL
jgi:hypothetical protein